MLSKDNYEHQLFNSSFDAVVFLYSTNKDDKANQVMNEQAPMFNKVCLRLRDLSIKSVLCTTYDVTEGIYSEGKYPESRLDKFKLPSILLIPQKH